MADVRDLVQFTFMVQIVSVALVFTLAVVMIALWPTRVLAAGLLYGAFLTGALFAVVGVLALSGFDSAWSNFHGLAFTNDLWQLDPDTDHLIQMFPEEFWFRATGLIAMAVMLQAILIAALSTGWLLFVREMSGRETPDRERPILPGRAGHSRLTGPDAPTATRP